MFVARIFATGRFVATNQTGFDVDWPGFDASSRYMSRPVKIVASLLATIVWSRSHPVKIVASIPFTFSAATMLHETWRHHHHFLERRVWVAFQ